MLKDILQAIERLESIQFSSYTKPLIAVEDVVKIIKSHMDDGWIPCSERLPTDDKYILLSFENFSVPLVGRYEDDEYGGAFYVGDDSETCGSQGIIVNAWMPLPEQYREES